MLQDSSLNDLLAEGWASFSGSQVLIDTNHPSLYARTVNVTGVATDNHSDPDEVLSQTFHITIHFVGVIVTASPAGDVSISLDVDFGEINELETSILFYTSFVPNSLLPDLDLTVKINGN